MSKKSFFIIIFLFFIYFLFYSISYSYSVSQELQENVFRLHIIANSDSTDDQNLKLCVRNEIIEYLNQFDFSSKSEMINYLREHTNEIEHIAHNCIIENGYSYPVSVEIGNSFFPKKVYGNISLPSGSYDGLKVKIGEASR